MCRINPLSAACAVLLAISLVSCGYDISDRPLALASQGSLWLAREDGSQRILIDSNTLSFAWVGDKIYWVKAHADENEDSDEQQEAKPIREIDLLWTDPTSAWETGSQPMQTAETWKGIPVPEKKEDGNSDQENDDENDEETAEAEATEEEEWTPPHLINLTYDPSTKRIELSDGDFRVAIFDLSQLVSAGASVDSTRATDEPQDTDKIAHEYTLEAGRLSVVSGEETINISSKVTKFAVKP